MALLTVPSLSFNSFIIYVIICSSQIPEQYLAQINGQRSEPHCGYDHQAVLGPWRQLPSAKISASLWPSCCPTPCQPRTGALTQLPIVLNEVHLGQEVDMGQLYVQHGGQGSTQH